MEKIKKMQPGGIGAQGREHGAWSKELKANGQEPTAWGVERGARGVEQGARSLNVKIGKERRPLRRIKALRA